MSWLNYRRKPWMCNAYMLMYCPRGYTPLHVKVAYPYNGHTVDQGVVCYKHFSVHYLYTITENVYILTATI